jgi:Ni,Fe-hydrogenase III large subunit
VSARASTTLSGARSARASWLGRLVARAAARDLSAFVVPGPEIARARGLDLEAAGLRLSATPRHASVLVVVGGLPEGLRKAAAVAYAQMPRPRAVLALGAEDVSPLPGPDVSVGLGGDALASGVAELRHLFAEGAFDPEAEGFEAASLRSRTEYTCSMHPEVVQDEPGTCPKCGMDLIPRETSESDEEGPAPRGHGGRDHAHHEGMDHDEGTGEGHSHAAHGQEHGESGGGGSETREHGGHGGMNHEDVEHSAEDHDEEGHGHEKHGGMDKGGMNHGGHEIMDHGDAEHGGHEGMDHGGMGFMSMVEMTQGTPRSSDGLQMEWVETPFGPLFPGLPGGLSLTFTLDGDTVAQTEAGSTVGAREDLDGPVESFVERVARMDPLSSFSYRLLALRAVESAAGARVDESVALARVGALERERAASHLNWLAGFGYLIGYSWLARRAEKLHLVLLRADAEEVAGIRTGVRKLARRVERTPLLRRKLAGIGKVPDLDGATGPVARSGGRRIDVRLEEETYRSLGFEPVVVEGDDALARLRARLAEAEQSLDFVEKAGGISAAAPETDGASGRGAPTVETPRGAAKLAVTLEGGEVTVAKLETPSARQMGLVKAVTEQRELADALVGVASLDLSPWEVVR